MGRAPGDRARAVHDALGHCAGLTALAGTADVREILAREHPDARLALGVHHHRLAAAVAGMAAAMGGIDVLAFTGGVGENAVPVRAAAAAQLGFLAVGIDAAGNGVVAGDGDITATGATVSTVVVAAREDIEMARQARELLST